MLSHPNRVRSCLNGKSYTIGLVIGDERGIIDTSEHVSSHGGTLAAGWARVAGQGEWANPLYLARDTTFARPIPLDVLLRGVKGFASAAGYYHRLKQEILTGDGDGTVLLHTLDIGMPPAGHEPIPATPATELADVVDGVARGRASDEHVGEDIFHPLYWLMHVRVPTLRESGNARLNPYTAMVMVARNPELFGLTMSSDLMVTRVRAPRVSPDPTEPATRGLDVDHLAASIDLIVNMWNDEYVTQRPFTPPQWRGRSIVMDMFPPVDRDGNDTSDRRLNTDELTTELARARLILTGIDRDSVTVFGGGRNTVRALFVSAIATIPRGSFGAVREAVRGVADRLLAHEVWCHVVPSAVVCHFGGSREAEVLVGGEDDYAIEIMASRTSYMDAAGNDVASAAWDVDLRTGVWLRDFRRARLRREAAAAPLPATISRPAAPKAAPTKRRAPARDARAARRLADRVADAENAPRLVGGVSQIIPLLGLYTRFKRGTTNAIVVVTSLTDVPRDGDCFFNASGHTRSECAAIEGIGDIHADGLTPVQFLRLVEHFNISVVNLRAPVAGTHLARVRGDSWIGYCDAHCYKVEVAQVRRHWLMKLVNTIGGALGSYGMTRLTLLGCGVATPRARHVSLAVLCIYASAGFAYAWRMYAAAWRAYVSYDCDWDGGLGPYPVVASRRTLNYSADQNAQMNSRLGGVVSAWHKHGPRSEHVAAALHPACVALGPFGSGGPRHSPDAVKHAFMYAAAAVVRAPREELVDVGMSPKLLFDARSRPTPAVDACIPDLTDLTRTPGAQYTTTQAICLGADHDKSPLTHNIGRCKDDRCAYEILGVGCHLVGPASGPCYALHVCEHNLRNACVNRHAQDEKLADLYMPFPRRWINMLHAARAAMPNHTPPGDPYLDWALRYPEGQRAELVKAWLNAPPKERSVDQCSGFVKRETNVAVPTKGRKIDTYADPRDKVMTGPAMAAMQLAVKEVCQDAEVYPNVFVTFGCGKTVEDIAKWASRPHSYVYERDGSRWDSTMGLTHYLFRLRCYEEMSPGFIKSGQYPAFTTEGRFSKKDVHFKYTINGTVKSGHNDTTLGNTLINLMIAAAAAHDQRPKKPVHIIACGDDLLLLAEERMNGARMAAVERAFGIIPKYGEFADVTSASFISLLFFRTARDPLNKWGVIATPKPGRLARKQYWVTDLPKDLAGWRKSVSGGIAGYRLIPIFRELWSFGKGTRADIIHERWERSRLERDLSAAASRDVAAGMCERYDMSPEELELAASSLKTARLSTGHAAQLLDRILQIDSLDPEDRRDCYTPSAFEAVDTTITPSTYKMWEQFHKSLPKCLITSSQIESLPQCSVTASPATVPPGSATPATPSAPVTTPVSQTVVAAASQPPASSVSTRSGRPVVRISRTVNTMPASSSQVVATPSGSSATVAPAPTSATTSPSLPQGHTASAPRASGWAFYKKAQLARPGTSTSAHPPAITAASAGQAGSSPSNQSCPPSTTAVSSPPQPSLVVPPTSASLNTPVTSGTKQPSSGTSTKPASRNSHRAPTQRPRRSAPTSQSP